MKALNYDVIVRLIEEEQTESGLYVPEKDIGVVRKGVVHSVGSKTSGDIKKGDIVLFSKNAGSRVEMKSITYVVLTEPHIFGILV